MPRFKIHRREPIKFQTLSLDSATRTVEIQNILNLIQSELAKINVDCINILKTSTIESNHIRTLEYPQNKEVRSSVIMIIMSEIEKQITQADVFDEFSNGATKYPIRREIYRSEYFAIQHFMNQIVEHLESTTNLLMEIQRVWEILRIYRKIYEFIFSVYNKQIMASLIYLHPPTNILISKLFYEIVYSKFYQQIVNELCSVFDEMRVTKTITRTYIRVMPMFIKITKRFMWYKNHGVTASYSKDFEKIYLDRLREYYKTVNWISTMGVSEYCKQVKNAHMFELELLQIYGPAKYPEEMDIIRRYDELGNTVAKQAFEKEYFISPNKCKNTWNRAQEILDLVLVSAQQTYIFTNPLGGLLSLFHNKNDEGFATIYYIYSRISSCDNDIAVVYKTYLSETMQVILKNITDEKFIDNIINFNQYSIDFINSRFKSGVVYQKALTDVMINSLNHDNTIVEYIVSYLDNIIQGKGEKRNDTEQEAMILKLLLLFKYIQDKDVFREAYCQLMAKRLINQRSNLDIERIVVAYLQNEAGFGYTSKIKNMISDIETKSDVLAEFQEYKKSINLSHFDFSLQILTSGAWPTFPLIVATLPPEMDAYITKFTEFYKIKYTHRQLRFILTGGIITIDTGRYEIQMIPIQAIVLMAFNDFDTATLENVSLRCGITSEIAKFMLHSLSCGKYKLIKKIPDTNTISATDIFTRNDKFTSPIKHFKMPVPNFNHTVINREKIDEDRTYVIEATIVRIMKSRKILSHVELVGLVIEQLQMFRPEPKTVKGRIEKLIEREYIERDETNTHIYKYLA